MKRCVPIQTMIFRTPTEAIKMSLYEYKQTVRTIEQIVKPRDDGSVNDFDGSRYTVAHILGMPKQLVRDLYQANPRPSTSKQFTMKLIIDNKPRFALPTDMMTIYLDTETSACDGSYKDVPMPTNYRHQLVIIQFLVQTSTAGPIQYVYHRKGYQYDRRTLKDTFPEVTIHFNEFGSERSMVDAFWNFVMAQKTLVTITGFNACHDITF